MIQSLQRTASTTILRRAGLAAECRSCGPLGEHEWTLAAQATSQSGWVGLIDTVKENTNQSSHVTLLRKHTGKP